MLQSQDRNQQLQDSLKQYQDQEKRFKRCPTCGQAIGGEKPQFPGPPKKPFPPRPNPGDWDKLLPGKPRPNTTTGEYLGYVDGKLQTFPNQQAAQQAGATGIQPNFVYQPQPVKPGYPKPGFPGLPGEDYQRPVQPKPLPGKPAIGLPDDWDKKRPTMPKPGGFYQGPWDSKGHWGKPISKPKIDIGDIWKRRKKQEPSKQYNPKNPRRKFY